MLPVVENQDSATNARQIRRFIESIKRFKLIIMLLVGLSTTYVLTRPCNLSSCPLLYESEDLANQTLKKIDLAATPPVWQSAQTTLNQVRRNLQAIPFWSQFYPQAQVLVQEYQAHCDHLEQLSIAQTHAQTAQEQMKKVPLSSEQWRSVEQLWHQAQVALRIVPQKSPFFALAQNQYRQVSSQLQVARQLHTFEKESIVALDLAQKTAQIAKSRQDNAQSPQDWQLVSSTWQTALEKLRQVEFSTTSHPKAQQQLKSYLSYLVKAQARQAQESQAQSYSDKAQELAQAATKSQNRQQWPQAVAQWSEAIAYLQQIPPNTFIYSSRQTLITQYFLALNQAKTNLDGYNKFQEIQQQLEAICQQKQRICNFQINADRIKLTLTSAYIQEVQKLASTAQAQTNTSDQISILNHLAKLETYLQGISTKAGKRLEVYNSQQVLLTRYDPQS